MYQRVIVIIALLTLLISVFVISGGQQTLQAEASQLMDTTLPQLSQVTIVQPDGTDDVIAEAVDFATSVLGDPWDMNQSWDIYPNGPKDNAQGGGFANASVNGGLFQGSTLSNDSYFWLHHQGYPHANNINPHSGLVNPIEAGQYSILAFRLYLSSADPIVPIRVRWYKKGDEISGNPSGESVSIASQAGWNVYTIDLGNASNIAKGSWSGQITGLRIDPTSTSNTAYKNKDIIVDWARLLKPGTAQRDTAGSYNITWTSDLAPGSKAVLSIGLDNDTNVANGVIQTLNGGVVSQANGSYTLNNPVLPPGSYYVHANLGVDYAGVVLGDVWDFNSAGDYVRLDNFTTPSLGGIFNATATTSDPQVWMRINPDKPIDTTIFNRFVVRVYVNKLSFLNIYWTRKGDSGPWQGYSQFRTLQPGWQIVEIDLANAANVAAGQWSGLVTDLRIDPVTEANINVQIDYIGMTSGTSIAAESELSPAQATSPGTLRVNQSPILKVTAPSMSSGDDYATTVLENPWDFQGADDLARTHEVQNLSYGPNGLTAQNIGGLHPGGCPNDCGDPQLWLRISDDPEKYIDAERFKYLTYRYWVEGVQDTFAGWVTRLIWSPNIFPTNASITDDYVTVDSWPSYTEADGWRTYQIDLTKTALEPDEYKPGENNWGWNNSKGKIGYFRFEPTEMPSSVTFHLGQIFLTADPVATGNYTIMWNIGNADDQAAVNVYYDTSNSGSARTRTLIGTVNQPTNSLVWDSSAVTPGTYYIYLEANDGYNSYGVYSNAPVQVRRQASITLQTPGADGGIAKRGQEFSQDVLGNAWDMDSVADIDSNVVGGISTPVFANGEMSFSSTAVDSNFWLSWDNAKPIDAATYSTLCFRMYAGQASQWQAFWYNQAETAYSTPLQLVFPGWNTYQLDMKQFGQWTGSLKRLRLDPLFAAGIDARIDWVKLVKPQSATYQVTWTAQNTDGATIDIYAAPGQSTANSVRLAQGVSPGASPYTLDIACLANGEYYLYAELKGANVQTVRSFSVGKLVISETGLPQLILSSDTANFLVTPTQTKSTKIGLSSIGGSYAWSIVSGYEKSWLSLTPTNGKSLPAELTLTADGTKLPLGQTDSTTVTVNVPGIGTKNIQVTLRVVAQVYEVLLPFITR